MRHKPKSALIGRALYYVLSEENGCRTIQQVVGIKYSIRSCSKRLKRNASPVERGRINKGLMFRILLVEDDDRVSAALTELLNALPEVAVAARATSEGSAVDWLIENRLGWDLAIVDLALGMGSGLRVLSACRVRKPHQKMVVLSNHLNQEMRRRCGTLGADAAFEKASDIEAVLDYCRTASEAAARRD